jgi:phage gp29-like protein
MGWRNWIGLAERTQAAPAVANTPDLTVHGATGTPILSGYLRDLGEYNPDLTGLSAFGTWEKMRRSDAQVAATLMGIKLPIRSAEWTVQEPEDATPVEREAADFVRQCLLEEIDLEAVIENALLMLDFGCAMHEDVWYVDGNRIRLRKLAARLPSTFNRWIVDGEENLVAIEQQGWKGGGYITSEIPASKIALFTFQQEGANFAGHSLLRSMYQHWFIKSNLYKIDAIALERNGMGVPVVKMGENAKAEDRKAAIEWLQKLTAHEKASMALPAGWDFKLVGIEGSVRDSKESIAHHNMQISMAGLAQFMMLGQSASGNRALGQTMSDFFYLALQSTANKIARVMNWTTIPRLVDFNFAGITRYPTLVPQQILSLRFESVVDALTKLAGAGIIEPDDEFETWMRQKMGGPEKGTPRPRPQQDTPPHGPGGGEPGAQGRKFSARLADVEGPKLRRQPRGAERFLALAEIVGELDRGRDAIAAALRAAKAALLAEIVNKVVNAPVRTMHRVSIAPDDKLVTRIEEILAEVYEFGERQVEAERERQRAGLAPSDAARVRAAEGKRKKRDPLGVYADGIVGEFVNTLTSRAVNVALDWLRRPGDLSKGEAIRRIEEELDGQSDRWIDGAAAKGANEAFADGRAAGYEERSDEISSVIYSALLDWNTCESCAAADGQEGRTPEDITPVPNPDCDGGDRCRCVHVFVFSDEVRQ